MNNEEINLDFLDNIKVDDEIDNDVKIEEPNETIGFDIDREEEEELDFDLNELISKIDAKMDQLNNDDSNEKEQDLNTEPSKEIKIEDSSNMKFDNEVVNDSNNRYCGQG